MPKPKTYAVFFLYGEVNNFVPKKLPQFFSEAGAELEIGTLNIAGYPAMKMEAKKAAVLGGFCSHDEFRSDKERKEYFQDVLTHYMPYKKPFQLNK